VEVKKLMPNATSGGSHNSVCTPETAKVIVRPSMTSLLPAQPAHGRRQHGQS
jgi:hypothetical protein